ANTTLKTPLPKRASAMGSKNQRPPSGSITSNDTKDEKSVGVTSGAAVGHEITARGSPS
ncbi:hypothetical protein L915_03214, partial [Phytophthora nicotianae]